MRCRGKESAVCGRCGRLPIGHPAAYGRKQSVYGQLVRLLGLKFRAGVVPSEEKFGISRVD